MQRIALSWVLGLGFSGLLLFQSTVPAQGAQTEVEVKDNLFDPDQVRVSPGEGVQWSRAGVGTHNIREDGRLFSSGPPTAGPIDFTATFSAGSFHYFCEIHGSKSGGMDGTVRVPASIARAPTGPPFTVHWATSATDTGSKFDVQYRIGSGKWRNWLKDTVVRKNIFGKKGRPVEVSTRKLYSFRARSQKGAHSSDWSPTRSFNP